MKIYALWHAGRQNAPEPIGKIFDLWEGFNPGWELEVYDEERLNALLAGLGIDPDKMTIQARADILRVHLLAKTGGVWTDATVLPTRPLDEWLPRRVEQAPFFAFRRPGRDRLISNWFLYAGPGSRLITAWEKAILRYWAIRRSRKVPWHLRKRYEQDPLWSVRETGGAAKPYFPYFWPHYLFEETVRSDPSLMAEWEAAYAYPAIIPHVMQENFEISTSEEFARGIAEVLEISPVHKLNWRKAWPDALFDQCFALMRSQGA